MRRRPLARIDPALLLILLLGAAIRLQYVDLPFAEFTSKQIIDAKSEVQTLLCLSIDNRADVGRDAVPQIEDVAGATAAIS